MGLHEQHQTRRQPARGKIGGHAQRQLKLPPPRSERNAARQPVEEGETKRSLKPPNPMTDRALGQVEHVRGGREAVMPRDNAEGAQAVVMLKPHDPRIIILVAPCQ